MILVPAPTNKHFIAFWQEIRPKCNDLEAFWRQIRLNQHPLHRVLQTLFPKKCKKPPEIPEKNTRDGLQSTDPESPVHSRGKILSKSQPADREIPPTGRTGRNSLCPFIQKSGCFFPVRPKQSCTIALRIVSADTFDTLREPVFSDTARFAVVFSVHEKDHAAKWQSGSFFVPDIPSRSNWVPGISLQALSVTRLPKPDFCEGRLRLPLTCIA